MPERRLRYGWIWLVVGADLVAGAALMMAGSPALRNVGVALLLVPFVASSALGVLYYWRSRRQRGG